MKKTKLIKGDLIVIGLILLIAVLSGLYTWNTNKTSSNLSLVVKIDGKIYKKYKLDKSLVGKTAKIDSKYGHNTIKFTEKGAIMYESDCKDKLCMKMGEVTRTGQSIICLPNRLVVELNSDKNDLDVMLNWKQKNGFFFLF